MFRWIRKITRPALPEDPILGSHARRELAGQIEALLLNHHTRYGADSLLATGLRVVAIHDGILLATEAHSEAICEVMLRELPSVLSFLVVREDNLAVPRDVVFEIAHEASRAISKRINLLAEPY